MSDGQRSTQRHELIQQFCQITGATEERAARMLDACDDNLQMAVTLEIDTQQGESLPTRSRTPTPPQAPPAAEGPLRRPVAPAEPPFSVGGHVQQRRSPSPAAARNVTSTSSNAASTSSSYVTAPASVSAARDGRRSPKRPKTFDELFRPPYDVMWNGNFVSAREEGTQSNKWLLVDLNNPLEFVCQVLNRDVWSDERIKTLVRENFIFWQTTSSSDEGRRFKNFYPVETWPFFAIIDPITGEKIISFSETDPNIVYQALVEFLDQRPAPEAKQGKTEAEAATRANPDVLANAVRGQNVGESNALNEAPSADDGQRDPVPNSDRWKQFLGPDVDPPTELLLRLPDGRKTVVSMPSSSKLQAVIVYVESLGYPPSRFSLVTAFPRRSISELPADSSLKDAGLFPRETVIIKER